MRNYTHNPTPVAEKLGPRYTIKTYETIGLQPLVLQSIKENV